MLEKYGYWASSATSYIVNKVLLEPSYTGSLIQSWLPYGTRPEETVQKTPLNTYHLALKADSTCHSPHARL